MELFTPAVSDFSYYTLYHQAYFLCGSGTYMHTPSYELALQPIFPVTFEMPDIPQGENFFLMHTPSFSNEEGKESPACFLTSGIVAYMPASLVLEYGACAPLAVGTTFFEKQISTFTVTNRGLMGSDDIAFPASSWAKAKALVTIKAGMYTFSARKEGYSLAVVTLSDQGAQGKRLDTSGPSLAFRIGEELPLSHAQRFLLPDSMPGLRTLVADLALHQGYDIIVTTGGTGVSPHDVTPEAVAPLMERPLPGFTQAMLTASLHATPHAILSRQLAGTIGKSIVLTVPGSKKAAIENIEAILPALRHTLEKLQGSTTDCGS